MSLYKRDNIGWIDFITASGERVKRSALLAELSQIIEDLAIPVGCTAFQP